MKLRDTVSWLMGTLQRQLFARLEECWESPLTAKEQQLISILELVHIEKFVILSAPQRFGRQRHDRRALARAFVAKAVYNHPFTCSTREALRTPRVCGSSADMGGGARSPPSPSSLGPLRSLPR
jgi:hypothetical protein